MGTVWDRQQSGIGDSVERELCEIEASEVWGEYQKKGTVELGECESGGVWDWRECSSHVQKLYGTKLCESLRPTVSDWHS